MRIDWYSKMVLTAVAFALWIIALNPWIGPGYLYADPVEKARQNERPGMQGLDLLNVRVWNIQTDMRALVQGECENPKICTPGAGAE
jgi:hypothetical protein